MHDDQRPIRKIACIGEVMIELIAGDYDTAKLGVAGDTFNTAFYLNSLLQDTDISVSYVTALGLDTFSERILTAISGHGILTDTIERRADAMPGLYAIQTDNFGERSFSYWRSASAARTLFSAPCDIGLDSLDQFDLVHLSGITLAILPPQTRSRFLTWVDGFRAKGGLVAYDSNHRPSLWESQQAAREINTAMWQRTDIALPSVDDEMDLFGDASEEAAFQRLKSFGANRGALKRGATGPRSLASGVGLSGDWPEVKVVDSTAAGDSFNAGYLSAICRAKDDTAAMTDGHRLASQVITQPGAIVDIQM